MGSVGCGGGSYTGGMKGVRLTRLWVRVGGVLVLVYCALTFDGRFRTYVDGWMGSRMNGFGALRFAAASNVGWLALLAMGLAAMFCSGWVTRMIWRGLEEGMCTSCGYDRRGSEGACPEWGEGGVRTRRRRRRLKAVWRGKPAETG
jgi:hypothetical protein